MSNFNNIITNNNKNCNDKPEIQVQKQECTFAAVDNLIVDNYDLSVKAKLAYAAIADFVEVGFFKSVKELAKLTNFKKRTFQKALDELIENEYLERKEQFDDKNGQQIVNKYILNDLSQHEHHKKYTKTKDKNHNHNHKVIDKRYRNFTRVDSLILHDEELTWKGKIVYMALVKMASEGGFGLSYPKLETLKNICNTGRNSVIDGINELINNGYLIKFKRRTSKRRTSNLYYLLDLKDHPFRDLYLTKKEKRKDLNMEEYLNKVSKWISVLEQTATNPKIKGVHQINEGGASDKRRGGASDKRRGCIRQTLIRTILIKNYKFKKNLVIKNFLKSFISSNKLQFINRTARMMGNQRTKKTLRIAKNNYDLLLEFFDTLEQKDLEQLNKQLALNIQMKDIESKIKLETTDNKNKEKNESDTENTDFKQFKAKINMLFKTDSNQETTELLNNKELQLLKEISDLNIRKIVATIENFKELITEKIISNKYIQVNRVSDLNLLKLYVYTNSSIERLEEDIKALFKKLEYCQVTINYLVGISRTRFNKNLVTKEDCRNDELDWLNNSANKAYFETGAEVNKAIFELLNDDNLLKIFVDKLRRSTKYDIKNYSLKEVREILRNFRDQVFYIKHAISPRYIFEKNNKDKLQKLLS